MAEHIEVNCPKCEERLQLDAGFAGAVCRCDICHTMFTVPRNARESTPEIIRGKAPSLTQEEQALSGIHYVTESGRKVRVSQPKQIPTAILKKQLKKKNNRTALIIMIASTISIMMIMSVGMWFIIQKQNRPANNNQTVEPPAFNQSFPYSRTASPFTLDMPNVMGLSIRNETAILIQAPANTSEAHWPMLLDAIEQGLSQPGHDSSIMLYALGQDVEPITSMFTPLPQLPIEDIMSSFTDLAGSSNDQSAADALEQALNKNPQAIILILTQPPSQSTINDWQERLSSHKELRLDILLIANQSQIPYLESLALDYQGQAHTLPLFKLQNWHEDWQGDN